MSHVLTWFVLYSGVPLDEMIEVLIEEGSAPFTIAFVVATILSLLIAILNMPVVEYTNRIQTATIVLSGIGLIVGAVCLAVSVWLPFALALGFIVSELWRKENAS